MKRAYIVWLGVQVYLRDEDHELDPTTGEADASDLARAVRVAIAGLTDGELGDRIESDERMPDRDVEDE